MKNRLLFLALTLLHFYGLDNFIFARTEDVKDYYPNDNLFNTEDWQKLIQDEKSIKNNNSIDDSTKLYYFNSLKKCKGLELSHKPGVYGAAIILEIATPNQAKIELITNGVSKIVSDSIRIDSPSIIRISFKDDNARIVNFVGSYIVNKSHELPIVSLIVDHDDFFPDKGIYVGTMKQSDSISEHVITSGKAWKKKPITAFAQFFFYDELVDELELDLKTYGGMTLGWKEKSLQLSARKEKHGRSKIKIKAFPNLPHREYQHIVLRTSGNDQNKTRIKDMSLSLVADEINLNTKDSRPSVVYINGVYWGVHNLREKVNKDYFQYRYGWSKDSFIELQGSGLHNSNFKSLFNFVNTKYNSVDFVERISDSIDVENFFNFNIFQTFISNPDYRGNVRFFKPNGGKWKWVVYDLDLGTGHPFLTRNFIQDRTVPIAEYWYNPPYAVNMLKHILMNDDLKSKFIVQYTYLLASKLRAKNFHDKIDYSVDLIKNELQHHFLRRDRIYNESMESWNKNIDYLKEYFDKRANSALEHLRKTFNLGGTQLVNVSQNMLHFDGLTINTSDVFTNEISGRFFEEYALELVALDKNHLYRFVEWSDGVKDAKRIIDLRNDSVNLIARYEHLKPSENKNIEFKKFYIRHHSKQGLIFLTLINTSSKNQQLESIQLFEDESGWSMGLSNLSLKPGEEIVFTNDCELFSQFVTNSSLQVHNFTAEINFLNSAKFVLLNKEGWIDSLQFEISDSLLIMHSSYLVEKNLQEISVVQKKSKHLNEITFGMIGGITGEKKQTNLLWYFICGSVLLIIVIMNSIRRDGLKSKLGVFVFCLTMSHSIKCQNFQDSTECTRIDKFGLGSLEKRSIDNKGKGDERFSGTRNFRVVLYDLVYRGGGDNLHLKDTIPKYYLWNPMPIAGIRQLSDIGFDQSVYLYSYNFDYWYPTSRIDSLSAAGFNYICRPKLNDYLDDYMKDIMGRAADSVPGMVYIHCWNGWHQSGLLSAYTLMQFCDYSNAEALKYWENCTDGNYKGFAAVKKNIRNFEPAKEFYFTDDQKARFCPCRIDPSASSASYSDDDKINLSVDEMMEKRADNTSGTNVYEYHTIKTGESLGSISDKYAMKISDLKRINGISGTTIYAGSKIKVIKRSGTAKSNAPANSPNKKSSVLHIVKDGDTLYEIAIKYKTTVEGIKLLNSLTSDTIFPSQKLRIPNN